MRTVWEYAEMETGIKLCRVYGEDVCPEVPESLEGRSVEAIGPYCFSAEEIPRRFREAQMRRQAAGETFLEAGEETPVRGERLRRVVLPETVKSVGDYCFYGCGKLESIGFSHCLERIGSGAFMGCGSLRQMEYTTSGSFRALAKVLSEVRYAVTVSVTEGEKRFSLVFPEYYEASVENIPARIFEVHFRGTGYRYRQCFRDGRLDLTEYDGLFPLAAGQEPVPVLVRLAYLRLLYPEGLSAEAKERYLDWFGRRVREAGRYLLEQDDLEAIRFLTEAGAFDRTAAPEAVRREERSRKTADGAGDFYMASLGEDIVEGAVREEEDGRSGREEPALDVLTELAAGLGRTEAVGFLMDHRHKRGGTKKKKTFDL